MSTNCQHVCNVTAPDSFLPSIPVDLLHEILAHLDTTTIVRCTAICKLIRRAVLDPGFQHRIALRADAKEAFLLGVSYALLDSPYSNSPVISVGQAPRQNPRFDSYLLESFKPVASRGGLVILRPRRAESFSRPDLRVCNTLTGQTSSIPSPGTVHVEYPLALFAVGDSGRSFKLLAADKYLRTQTFSTDDGQWGPVVKASRPRGIAELTPFHDLGDPVVLGGTVIHWMYTSRKEVVALDISTTNAKLIKLPHRWRAEWTGEHSNWAFRLVASADERLSLLVAEWDVISMWTLSETEWTRQVVITKKAIGRVVGEDPSYSVPLLGFGERTGAVILQMDNIGLIHVNLASKEARILRCCEFDQQDVTGFIEMCVHEIDLSSVLQAMRPF
ncbi:hypothetical protein EJB05_04243, partial [Eragrostis curvula]